MDKAIRNPRFIHCVPLGKAGHFEVHSHKSHYVEAVPLVLGSFLLQVDFCYVVCLLVFRCRRRRRDASQDGTCVCVSVLQNSKERLLRFYYDLLVRFVPREKFECVVSDTDALYFDLATETLDEAVRPELREEWQRVKAAFIETEATSRRPNLFKKEFEGEGIVALGRNHPVLCVPFLCSTCLVISHQSNHISSRRSVAIHSSSHLDTFSHSRPLQHRKPTSASRR